MKLRRGDILLRIGELLYITYLMEAVANICSKDTESRWSPSTLRLKLDYA